jgi:translation initiation factor IF-2
MNLDKLEEAILLQADMLQLKANPKVTPRGIVVEAKLERGRGAVATILIQKGSLKIGQIFVAGTQWGRVRALINDRGENIKEATPSMPVEVLGWDGAPQAGDEFVVVDSDAKAREVTEYRLRKQLAERSTLSAKSGSIEDIFNQIKKGEIAELPIIIKADTQGSLEAIKGSLAKFDNDEVKAKIIHGATGGVTQSDISLGVSTGAIVIGFNVRANNEARQQAERDGQDIRYYSIIYDLIDDIKGLMSGMLAPDVSEDLIGYAQIRQVFKVSKVGNIAGCYITDGVVKRGAGVRILRDDVVIYEGSLKQLKREKDDVKEVKQTYECGMMFENYDDIKEGDVVECFEKIETKREL